MEQILLDNINKAIKPFVKELMGVLERIKEQEKEYDKRVNIIKEQEKDLRRKDEEREKSLNEGLSGITTKENDLNMIQQSLQTRASDYTNLISKVRIKEEEVSQTLREAKLERKLAVEERERIQEIKRTTASKLAVLSNDENKLQARSKDLNDREDRIKIKEKNNLVQEERNAETNHQLEERESEIKLEEKRIELELKRLKIK